MKSIALSCVAAASVFFSFNAFATTIETYCGTPMLGAADDLQPGMPNINGMEVTSSTNAKVTQVISKFGKHTVTFTYEDSPHIRRIASQVAQASGATQDQQQGQQQQGQQQQGQQQQGQQQQGQQQQGQQQQGQQQQGQQQQGQQQQGQQQQGQLQQQQAGGVCIDAETFELSKWGTPVVVFPLSVLN